MKLRDTSLDTRVTIALVLLAFAWFAFMAWVRSC
jgi:hypothetical protein